MGEVGGSVSGSDKKLAEIAKIALSDEGELGTGAGEDTHLTKKKNNYKTIFQKSYSTNQTLHN